MKEQKRLFEIFLVFVLNIIGFGLVAFSIVYSINSYNTLSFQQDISNIEALTESATSQFEKLFDDYSSQIVRVSRYVSVDDDTGMNVSEINDFINHLYQDSTYQWQIIDSEPSNITDPTNYSFDGYSLSGELTKVSYPGLMYSNLSSLFKKANKDSLFSVFQSTEFTTPVNFKKCFCFTCPVKIYNTDKTATEFKSLVLIIESSYINTLLTSSLGIQDYDGYSSAIVDSSGDYVFSSSSFFNNNLFNYINDYNDVSDEDNALMKEKLLKNTTDQPWLFRDNKKQDCAFVIRGISGTDWHYVSSVPLSSFKSNNSSLYNYLYFFLSIIYLVAVDFAVIFVINKRLRIKSEEAKQANLAKSQFLSSMSHDIRTPMNAIVGMTEIADEALSHPEPDYEVVKDSLRTIEASGDSLLTLINDILDISKIESGKIVLSRENFSIPELVDRMVNISQVKIKNRNFAFEAHLINVTDEIVVGDPVRINQIFTNIFSNALKYTNDYGKIILDLEEQESPLGPSYKRYIYQVADNGIGMDEEFQKNIFNQFSRAVDTRINSIQGTGLGMSIVKQLVDLMGGKIEIQSKLNVGSTFTVTLDLPFVSESFADFSFKGKTLLAIDDDNIVLKCLGTLLSQLGIFPVLVDSGLKGLEEISKRKREGKEPFDFILVDWVMPEMSGNDAVQKIRSEVGQASKIIVISAYNVADIEAYAKKAGSDRVISKPLFISKLRLNLQEVYANKVVSETKKFENFNLSCLVAEDNDTNWKVLEKILSRYGVKSVRAKNGQEAVDFVKDKTYNFDLIFMDIQMPIMNGYEATKVIRGLNDFKNSQIKIYAMTADAFSEDVLKAKEVGMNGHLAKPVDIKKLVEVLSYVSMLKNNFK
ncbi:MAG: response regulator [Bacilli bacterium]